MSHKKSLSFLFTVFLGALFSLQAQGRNFGGDWIRNHPTKAGWILLDGNTYIISNGHKVYSDFCEYNPASRSCEAHGNLRIITRDKVKITGRKLILEGQTEIFDVIDDVVLVDGDVTMKTQRLKFDAKKNNAYYNTKAVMNDKTTNLVSNEGFYNGKSKTFHCYKDVVVVNPEYTIWSDTMEHREGYTRFQGPTNMETSDYFVYCEDGWYDKNKELLTIKYNAWIKTESQTLFGDSIFYNLGKKFGTADFNVKCQDTAENAYIWSDRGENDENKGRMFFTGNARAYMIDKADTLFLSADTMKVNYDTNQQMKSTFAYHNVKIFREDFQALCDTLAYYTQDSLMYLLGKPLMWASGYEISGDSVKVQMKNAKPDYALIRDNAFMVEKINIPDAFNQVKSKRITAYFGDSTELRTIVCEGRAEAIYYVMEDGKDEVIGINKSLSKILKLNIEDRAVKGVGFIEPEKNALYPETSLTDREKRMKGFLWRIEKRPASKFSVFSYWE